MFLDWSKIIKSDLFYNGSSNMNADYYADYYLENYE